MQRAIQRPIYRAIRSGLLTLPGGFNPSSLFSGTDKGYIYDNNDLSSFYLDSAGTTAATVNGLVGLQLDKSANLALGSELRASGAIGLVGTATAATYDTSTGAGSVTRVDIVNQSFVQWTGLTATAFYRIDISNTGANDLGIRNGSGGAGGTVWYTLPAGQSVVAYVPATDGIITISARPSGASSTTFTLNSIKLLSGNHRYQTTTGSKPILRGTPVGSNLVTNGDFASGTGWTAGAGWAIGSGVATATASSGTLTSTLTATIGKVYRVVYTLATATAGSVLVSFGGVSGVSRTTAGTYTDYLTASSTAAFVLTGTGFSGTIDNITVHDVSADAVTAPYGLQYDGIDDFLTTASVDFTATDKMAVVMGVRKLSDAAVGIVAELSAHVGLNAGSFALYGPNTAYGAATFVSNSRGSAADAAGLNSTASGYASPVTAVIATQHDIIGDLTTLRVNATATTPATGDKGTGNFGNYPLYFGRRGGSSFPFNGLDYGGICVNKTLTATQLSSAERWTAIRTGVTL